jgi:hypothetical protein
VIGIAYHLHNLYCAFESLFQSIAEEFGNHLDDRSGWHARLLRRMTLAWRSEEMEAPPEAIAPSIWATPCVSQA